MCVFVCACAHSLLCFYLRTWVYVCVCVCIVHPTIKPLANHTSNAYFIAHTGVNLKHLMHFVMYIVCLDSTYIRVRCNACIFLLLLLMTDQNRVEGTPT
jgi:hypothetical protein